MSWYQSSHGLWIFTTTQFDTPADRSGFVLRRRDVLPKKNSLHLPCLYLALCISLSLLSTLAIHNMLSCTRIQAWTTKRSASNSFAVHRRTASSSPLLRTRQPILITHHTYIQALLLQFKSDGNVRAYKKQRRNYYLLYLNFVIFTIIHHVLVCPPTTNNWRFSD